MTELKRADQSRVGLATGRRARTMAQWGPVTPAQCLEPWRRTGCPTPREALRTPRSTDGMVADMVNEVSACGTHSRISGPAALLAYTHSRPCRSGEGH